MERQKKLKPGEKEDDVGATAASAAISAEEGAIELGAAMSRKRRHVAPPTATEVVDGES